MNNLKLMQRNIEIAEMYFKEDISYAELGRQFNLSGGRISEIIDKLIRMMKHPSRLKRDFIPDNYTFSLSEIKRDKDFWINQLTKLKEEYKYTRKSDNPNDPFMVSKGIYIVRNYKAMKVAIDAHMSGISFLGYENYAIPDYFPALICIHPSTRGKDYVDVTSTPLKNLKSFIR